MQKPMKNASAPETMTMAFLTKVNFLAGKVKKPSSLRCPIPRTPVGE